MTRSDHLGLTSALVAHRTLLLDQAIAALDQFLQPLGEPGRRGAVDQVVIEADRQAQVLPRAALPVDVLPLAADAADRDPADGRGRRRDAPPGPSPTMPTADSVTVPQLCFHACGNRFPIRVATEK